MVHLYNIAIKLPDVFKQFSLYYINLFIDITTSMSFAWSISLSFISLMLSVKKAQFLNITFYFLLFGDVAVSLFEVVMVPLTSMYVSL